MSVPSSLLSADNDRAFEDWSDATATYRRIATSQNYQTGTTTETPSNTTVNPMTSPVDQKMVNDSGGRYQVGDQWFRIRISELPETPPKRTSRIIYRGVTYQAVEWAMDSDELNYDILGRATVQ